MTDMQYYSLLTNSGHQANIKAKALGLPIVLSKVAFGSGNITPTESATGLVKEEIRVNISSVIQNEIDKNILEIEAVIPSDVGGFMINEAALYLEDETLYAIINLPASYKPSIDQGAGKEFVFTILLASVGVENVTLKIDDSIVFATRKYVQNELKKYALINGDETKKFKVADATEPNEAISKKQFDDNAVKLTGNQTIAGVKTFSLSPIVPTPTADFQAATKKYVDGMSSNGLGVGQTWLNVTSSRTAGVTYTNTTGKPIQVFIAYYDSGIKTMFTINGINVNYITTDTFRQSMSYSFIVPNNCTYKFSGTSVVTAGIWLELRGE